MEVLIFYKEICIRNLKDLKGSLEYYHSMTRKGCSLLALLAGILSITAVSRDFLYNSTTLRIFKPRNPVATKT